jgi:hypothetical protein
MVHCSRVWSWLQKHVDCGARLISDFVVWYSYHRIRIESCEWLYFSSMFFSFKDVFSSPIEEGKKIVPSLLVPT